MIEIDSTGLIARYGRLILFLKGLAYSDFDYAAFYRWYRRAYPREFRQDLAQTLLLLLNPLSWIRAFKEKSMIIRRHLVALCLTILFAVSACAPKPNIDPTTGQPIPVSSEQIIAQVKDITAALAQAVDEGIALEATLATQGAIDPQIEPQIKRWLLDSKIGVDAFNARLQTYTKFDSSAKADILKFSDDALILITKLNDEGVLRIKDPRSQLAAAGIIAGARVAVRILKSYADREVAPARTR